jgi:L-alanine-DL-glutamate epimerase-like enolase superfamily enzyme
MESAMNSVFVERLSLRVAKEQWPLKAPFLISGHRWDILDVIVVTLEKDGHIGRGEAAGVYYLNEDVALMVERLETLRTSIEAGVSRDSLQTMLPPGGARNALDCALWDLESKLTGRPCWQLAGISSPKPLLTTFGCGADTPDTMAAVAKSYTHARAIKLKLTGEPIDAERVSAVRDTCPGAWLGVDANQGFSRTFLERLMPILVRERVSLIEQPFPLGQEALLDSFASPIPVAADESAQTLSDVPKLVGRFDVVNIKLDKSGGLTEALAMAHLAKQLGLETMVGNMIGTSLAMAPAYLIGQLCTVVDLDGPIFLNADRPHRVQYTGGFISCANTRWGNAS